MLRKRIGNYYFCIILLILLLQMTGCAIRPHQSPTREAKTVEVGEKEKEQKASRQGQQVLSSRDKPHYRLGFGDVIEVKFFNNEKFNETLTVRPDGRISMQKVGDIPVAGLTPNRLSQLIAKIYARILKNPEVTVIVRNFGGSQVYILGEVNSPGAIPLQRNLTILQTLAQAGGYTEAANLKSVLLMRRLNDGTIDASRVNLRARSEQALMANDLYVKAADIIYVPKTFIANVNTFVDQALAGFIKPLDVYLRAAWYYGR